MKDLLKIYPDFPPRGSRKHCWGRHWVEIDMVEYGAIGCGILQICWEREYRCTDTAWRFLCFELSTKFALPAISAIDFDKSDAAYLIVTTKWRRFSVLKGAFCCASSTQ